MKGKVAKAVLCASLGNILWGFSFLFTRVGLNVAPNPNVMLSRRFMLSAMFMAFSILFGKANAEEEENGVKFLPLIGAAGLETNADTAKVLELFGGLYVKQLNKSNNF